MKLRTILIVILAVIAGEATLVLLTTLVQEVFFDGISWTHSPTHHLILGGLGTFLSALIAGYVAWRIVRGQNYIAHLIITLLITAEMSWLISTGRTPDPLWFDALAGLSLIAGIWAGTRLNLKRYELHTP